MNLEKIKYNAFKKAVHAAASSCSCHNGNHLLACSAQQQLEAIKLRAEEFIQGFELNSLNYKEIENYEQIMAEAVCRELVLVIQSENLPEYEANLIAFEQTLQRYYELEKKITENFSVDG